MRASSGDIIRNYPEYNKFREHEPQFSQIQNNTESEDQRACMQSGYENPAE